MHWKDYRAAQNEREHVPLPPDLKWKQPDSANHLLFYPESKILSIRW